MMIVPEAANVPPTPWQTDISVAVWVAPAPRIWRTLSYIGYMPYLLECK